MPKVSIIIPAYKSADFIAEALDSVFAQTFTDFEAIVINDGSPDSSEFEQVLGRYREQIIYLKQDNRGPSVARNLGIRQARGEYIAFLDSDDCWLPDYLSSQMKLFEETPSLDMVYSDALHFGNPALEGKTYMQTCRSKGPVTLDSLIREDCQVLASCSVARKQTVMDAGLFDENFRRCEDYDLWLRILHNGGRIAYQKKVLGRYRSRPGSLSHNSLKMTEALVAVYEKADRTMDLSEETRAVLRKQLAQTKAYIELEAGKQFLAARDFGRAKDSLTKANHFFRLTKLKVAILGLRLAPRLFRLAAMKWQGLVSKSGPVA